MPIREETVQIEVTAKVRDKGDRIIFHHNRSYWIGFVVQCDLKPHYQIAPGRYRGLMYMKVEILRGISESGNYQSHRNGALVTLHRPGVDYSEDTWKEICARVRRLSAARREARKEDTSLFKIIAPGNKT